jgi:predicted amino acid racemase
MIEKAIGRKLDIISGGARRRSARVDNTMPERINNLRIGEGINPGQRPDGSV